MDVFKEYFEQYKIPIALCLVGIVLIIGGVVTSSKPQKDFSSPSESIVDSNSQITIDVSGAVKTPGIYKLQQGSRLQDAILAAGGFTDNANSEFVSKYLNLAQKASDGSKLYIPFKGEKDTDLAVSSEIAGVSSQGQININSASQEALEALPGIGPVTAGKIVSNRPYQSIEELLSKKVVGKATFDKIKSSLVVY